METSISEILLHLGQLLLTILLIIGIWQNRKKQALNQHLHHQSHELLVDHGLALTRIEKELEKLEKNSSDLNIRMHVTEARLDERKNVTIDQAPLRGKPGRPKGYSPKKAKELEQK